MPNDSGVLDRVFHSLSNSTRRKVLASLGSGPATMSELAAHFEMALPSFLQHMQVLEDSGMVSSRKTGRVRVYKLEPQSLLEAEHWIDRQRKNWESRLDQLDSLLGSLKENKE